MAYGITGPAQKKGLFGKQVNPLAYSTGIGDAMKVQHSPQERQMAQPTPEQKGPGFFDKGGASQYVFAGIQDFLQRRMGEQPTGVSNLMQRQMAEQQAVAQASQAQLQRAQELGDWRWKEDYKAANETSKPTSLQQNYEWLLENDPDAAKNYLERMTDNSEYRVGPDGRFYRVDNGGGAPAAPVGKLTPISGGPTARQSGDFRP